MIWQRSHFHFADVLGCFNPVEDLAADAVSMGIPLSKN